MPISIFIHTINSFKYQSSNRKKNIQNWINTITHQHTSTHISTHTHISVDAWENEQQKMLNRNLFYRPSINVSCIQFKFICSIVQIFFQQKLLSTKIFRPKKFVNICIGSIQIQIRNIHELISSGMRCQQLKNAK